MNIAVCVKQVPDTTETKRLDPSSHRLVREGISNILNPQDEYAIEAALQIVEAQGSGEVRLICMGPPDARDAIRRGLAMGAESAVLISDPALAGADALGTATVLAAAIKTAPFDLVLFGAESTDARTGLVPPMVGALLAVPTVTGVEKIELGEGRATVHRETDDGYWEVEATLPAVLGVVKSINEPRLPSLKGIMAAKRKTVTELALAGLGLDPAQVGGAGARVSVTATEVPPPRGQGEIVASEGQGGVKIAAWLVQRKLI